MKRIVLTAAVALMALACDKHSSFTSSYTSVCGFEVPEDVARDFYNEDGIHLEEYFFFDDGALVYYGAHDEGKTELLGGLALAAGKDDTLEEGHYALTKVFSKTGGYGVSGGGYALFRDGDSGPEHDIRFISPGVGSCAPNFLYVNNVNAVVNAFHFGTEGGVTRKDGDYMKFRATGSLRGKVTGTAEVMLIDCVSFKQDSVVTNWTRLDLTPLGKVDAIDFSVESNIEGLPAYACIDAFTANLSFKLE